MNTWTVEPYAGVGPIRFGMSPKDVEAILGPVVQTKDHAKFKGLSPFLMDQYKGFVTEFREDVPKYEPVLSYKFKELVLIDFCKEQKNLIFMNIFLFKENRKLIVEQLTDISKNIVKTFEGFIFLDFGVMMSSVENYKENPNIGFFKRGYYDNYTRDLI